MFNDIKHNYYILKLVFFYRFKFPKCKIEHYGKKNERFYRLMNDNNDGKIPKSISLCSKLNHLVTVLH